MGSNPTPGKTLWNVEKKIIIYIYYNNISLILKKCLFKIGFSKEILFYTFYAFPYFLIFFKIFNNKKNNKKPIKNKSFSIFLILSFFLNITIFFLKNFNKNYLSFQNYLSFKDYLLIKIYNYPNTFIPIFTLLAPLCEEIFFRKIILNEFLIQKVNPIKAIILSSFLFGFIHNNPIQFLSGVIIGIIIGINYVITFSIKNCIIIHSFNNVIFIIFSFLFLIKNY
ncbi:CPBP family intramembrane glutamic endopeptidase [Candidatus Karelsulcia muelleri]|uniref:CPBP family intramembrane glutamic endopeptidase n=1 Tax=Candidatus Karelsulcia muelleri TaxID=336810 RepID=UPI000D7CB3D0|nr:type II CAAX endopeptidase family protein [Candidatus Karelsulcia muelleri]